MTFDILIFVKTTIIQLVLQLKQFYRKAMHGYKNSLFQKLKFLTSIFFRTRFNLFPCCAICFSMLQSYVSFCFLFFRLSHSTALQVMATTLDCAHFSITNGQA